MEQFSLCCIYRKILHVHDKHHGILRLMKIFDSKNFLHTVHKLSNMHEYLARQPNALQVFVQALHMLLLAYKMTASLLISSIGYKIITQLF